MGWDVNMRVLYVAHGFITHLGSHSLGGELLDLADGAGSTLLEGDALQPLVEVDGVLAGNSLLGALLVTGHLLGGGDNERNV